MGLQREPEELGVIEVLHRGATKREREREKSLLLSVWARVWAGVWETCRGRLVFGPFVGSSK